MFLECHIWRITTWFKNVSLYSPHGLSPALTSRGKNIFETLHYCNCCLTYGKRASAVSSFIFLVSSYTDTADYPRLNVVCLSFLESLLPTHIILTLFLSPEMRSACSNMRAWWTFGSHCPLCSCSTQEVNNTCHQFPLFNSSPIFFFHQWWNNASRSWTLQPVQSRHSEEANRILTQRDFNHPYYQ